MPIRAVLFDFDGTLADSFGAITASVNHVRESYALPPLPEQTVREYVGLGLSQLMRDLLPNVPVEEAVARYRTHHTSVMLSGTKLLPGVLDTLTVLHQRGYRLAVCSNKAVAFTRELVRHLGLAALLDAVLGPEDAHGHAKPDPDILLEALRRLGVSPKEAIYVGDMAVDVYAGRAAGLPVWLVPGPAVGRERPTDAGPDRTLPTFSDLVPALSNLNQSGA
jgi:phosphoglycolate phosphatase